jgi:hypothetical protein
MSHKSASNEFFVFHHRIMKINQKRNAFSAVAGEPLAVEVTLAAFRMAIDKASEHKMCCQASFDESVLDVLLCKNHSHPPTPSEKNVSVI